MNVVTSGVAAAAGAAAWVLQQGGRRLAARCMAAGEALAWTQHNLLYRGSPTDVFVTSYRRSGTTLMQVLLYQLMTDGDLDRLSSLPDFSPHIDTFVRPGFTARTIDALPAPHVLKSHLPYERIPKGPGKYIYVMRNGLDVAISNYYRSSFRAGEFSASFPPFLSLFMRMPQGTWFDHVAAWLRNRDGLAVLYVTYEDLHADFVRTARRVAAFCDVTVPEAEWGRIRHNCSFEVMRRYEHKFDAVRAGDPADHHFVRRGRVGQWTGVDAAALARFQAEFDRMLKPLGAPEYLGTTAPVDAGLRVGT
jgi:hypothetical protein